MVLMDDWRCRQADRIGCGEEAALFLGPHGLLGSQPLGLLTEKHLENGLVNQFGVLESKSSL